MLNSRGLKKQSLGVIRDYLYPLKQSFNFLTMGIMKIFHNLTFQQRKCKDGNLSAHTLSVCD